MIRVAKSGTRSARAGRSRREWLTGAAGAAGGLAAATLVKAAPAQATQGQPVIAGQDNTGTTVRTGVYTTGNNEWGVLADPNSSGHGSLGVYGHGQNWGVYGDASGSGGGVVGIGGPANGDGVFGIGNGSGTGLRGVSGNGGVGVRAETTGGSAAALVATGPSIFHGTTTFSRSGVLTVRSGRSSATQAGVPLTTRAWCWRSCSTTRPTSGSAAPCRTPPRTRLPCT